MSAAVAVPVQLNYADTPPVAIESRPQRRLFFPVNGQTFAPNNTNQIRIDVNADSMLDFSHSYLQFDFDCGVQADASGVFLDAGCPVINRLQIESGGVILEDIQEWNRLYALLCEFQGDNGNTNDWGMTQGSVSTNSTPMNQLCGGAQPGLGGTLNTAAVGPPVVNAQPQPLNFGLQALGDGAGTAGQLSAQLGIQSGLLPCCGWADPAVAAATAGLIAPDQWTNWVWTAAELALMIDRGVADSPKDGRASYRYNIPLMCGLGMLRKYFPLIFLNQGITIVLHLESGSNVGAWVGSGRGGVAPLVSSTAVNYQITNVRFCAHLVDLDRSFYERLRSTMEASGGVMTLASTTYRHFTDTIQSGTSGTINIPARIKSIKALLVRQVRSDQDGQNNSMNIGQSTSAGLNQYSFRVGAVKYPPSDIQINYQNSADPHSALTNAGEVFQEVRKAFGTTNCCDASWRASYECSNIDKSMLQSGPVPHAGVGGQSFIVSKVSLDTGAAGLRNNIACCKQNFMYGFDFEGFSKSAIQSGINTQDRSLPITLETRYNATNPMTAGGAVGAGNTASGLRVDSYAMCDILFYIDATGNITSRI